MTNEWRRADALKTAYMQGRVTGEHPCPVCGLRHWTEDNADMCCIPGIVRLWLDRLEADNDPT